MHPAGYAGQQNKMRVIKFIINNYVWERNQICLETEANNVVLQFSAKNFLATN